MHNFPVPYENEMIYSLVARAGVHAGIISPKQLLEEVYGDRKVVATIDLPSHLQSIAKNLNRNPKFTCNQLIDRYTLFPAYASFIHEQTRKKARAAMKASSKGVVHLSLGVAASRLKHLNTIKYCPLCLKHQLKQHGEMYWERQWQYFGVDVCKHHGRLEELKFNLAVHRHEYITPGKQQLKQVGSLCKTKWEQMVAEEFFKLLTWDKPAYPSFEQWTKFYQSLAHEYGCNRRNQTNHEAVWDRVEQAAPKIWMTKKHVLPGTQETSWLRTIFRKHRKSFSFIEHLIVIKSYLPSMSLTEAVIQASKIETGYFAIVKHGVEEKAHVDKDVLKSARSKWHELVSSYGSKRARSELNGAALYAWLYRHDRAWLLAKNSINKVARDRNSQRVDWSQRDVELTNHLSTIVDKLTALDYPRLTKNWLVAQLPHSSSIAKNLYRLPLLLELISATSESTAQYQLRRLKRAEKELRASGEEVKRWKLFRKAGLSKERITPEVDKVVQKLSW
jgi:hypothetical protein